MKHKQLLSLTYIALSAALIAICSWLQIPMTIPFTMQTFAVFLIAALLTVRDSVLAVVVYLLLGIIGLPVFSGFRSGIGTLLSATGGYLIGFVFMALLESLLLRLLGNKLWSQIISMVLGLAVCYLFGTLWFCYVYSTGRGFVEALTICVVPYLPADALKMALAILVARPVKRFLYRA